MKIYVRLLTLAISLFSLSASAAPSVLRSPDGSIVVTFQRSGNDMSYQVDVNGECVIGRSALGLQTKEWQFPKSVRQTVKYNSADETWTQPWGENKSLRDHHNEMLVKLDKERSEWCVRFRAFDDGVAFRYEWNLPGVDSLTIIDELTEFNFVQPTQSWSIPGSFETYELEYRNLPVSEVKDANTPFTFRTDGGVYGSIHEAALYDYPEMTLLQTGKGVLKANLAPMPSGVKARVSAKFHTPWRTIQIAPSAVGLINSSLILNLNEPSKISDTSWIKPQKYVGIWWGMHLGTQIWKMGPRHGATTENAVRYIDFAAANNIQGVLFEGWNKGWENWGGSQHFDYLKAYPDFDIEYIARYARDKGIELWAHNETGGNIPEYEAVMDSAFAYYQSLGIHTLKTGYAGGFKGGYFHHSQYGVEHYQRVVEDAARHQLMVDAHEPIKETGIRRTWPNMMTREGARGMEWNAWSKGNDADYLCTLPYVRLLSGPMDYTPGIFDIDYSVAKADTGRIEWNGPNGDCRIRTTIARQIANWVIIYSPLQMAADDIENYEDHPAFQFFRDFNADSDWSEALQGEIGKYIVVARRAGDDYFLGAGTNSERRTITQKLDFLRPGVTYLMTVYGDVPGSDDAEDIVITTKKVTADDVITIVMNSAGGQAITFKPAR